MIIRGGTVVDGTGAPGRHRRRRHQRRPDRGHRRHRRRRRRARSTPTGKVVAPGFVDIHTHYDAQVFWDTTLSPSPLHGVTTVIGGNCGFTIAPLGPEHGDYLMRMLARVEGMPLAALAEGVPWDWRTLRRVPRPHRRHARAERRVPRRPLDDPPRRDGRARDAGRGDARRPRRDARAARREPRRRRRSASRRAGPARTTTRPATWCRRATRARTRSSRCAAS